MAFAFVSTTVDARRVVTPATMLPLENVSYRDAERAGAVGTGCTWRGGSDRKGRLSMADDRAAVKRDGVVVALRPAADAKEVFPFTYHHWTGGGMDIAIRDTGKVTRRGHEFVETAAWLDLLENGRKRSWRGRLNCGS